MARLGESSYGGLVIGTRRPGTKYRITETSTSASNQTNRTSAADVVRLLAAMHASAVAAPFEASLAVAGRSGTLRHRLRSTAAARACRGKTGTLNRVSALAGLCTTRQGHVLAFALLMDDVTIWRGHLAQDRALRALVAYRAPVLVPTAGRASR